MKNSMTKLLAAVVMMGSVSLALAEEHDHGSMDMSDMNMQGGDAPADARDPHDYSNGYTLHSGPYLYDPKANHSMMDMGDTKNIATLLVDRLERTYSKDSNATTYEMQAWYGNAYNKAVLKAEGEVSEGRVHDARTELLWGRAFVTFWDTQLGVRNDSGSGQPSRNWLAMGVQGLAPYWFEVDATAYVGNEGRTALRLSAEYDFLLTQRLMLQPRAEANLYGKNDPELQHGSGLSDATVGIRLRYEFSRQFSPYIGVERFQSFGNTADMIQASGGRRGEGRVVAGVRLWF